MSNSVRPPRQQPTRLLCPWDSPGKNTGVGCHFLLQCMKVKSESKVAQSCPTLCDPMDCSPLGSSVHGFSRQEYWSGLPLPSPKQVTNNTVLQSRQDIHNLQHGAEVGLWMQQQSTGFTLVFSSKDGGHPSRSGWIYCLDTYMHKACGRWSKLHRGGK